MDGCVADHWHHQRAPLRHHKRRSGWSDESQRTRPSLPNRTCSVCQSSEEQERQHTTAGGGLSLCRVPRPWRAVILHLPRPKTPTLSTYNSIERGGSWQAGFVACSATSILASSNFAHLLRRTAMLCYAMLCYAILWYAMQCYAILTKLRVSSSMMCEVRRSQNARG
jgi:hypothetical protein